MCARFPIHSSVLWRAARTCERQALRSYVHFLLAFVPLGADKINENNNRTITSSGPYIEESGPSVRYTLLRNRPRLQIRVMPSCYHTMYHFIFVPLNFTNDYALPLSLLPVCLLFFLHSFRHPYLISLFFFFYFTAFFCCIPALPLQKKN